MSPQWPWSRTSLNQCTHDKVASSRWLTSSHPAETLGQRGLAHRLTGTAAGKEPAGATFAPMPDRTLGERGDECAQRLGQWRGRLGETDRHLAADDGDGVGAQRDDAGDWLGEGEHQEPRRICVHVAPVEAVHDPHGLPSSCIG